MQLAERTKAGQKSRKATPFYYDRPTMDVRLSEAKNEGKLVPQDLKTSDDILQWLLAQ